MTEADVFDGIIIGAAAAAIGTIIAMKFIEKRPIGGTQPNQIDVASPTVRYGRLVSYDDPGIPDYKGGLVVQNSPITEAAYNQEHVQYSPAFVNEDEGSMNDVLPI